MISYLNIDKIFIIGVNANLNQMKEWILQPNKIKPSEKIFLKPKKWDSKKLNLEAKETIEKGEILFQIMGEICYTDKLEIDYIKTNTPSKEHHTSYWALELDHKFPTNMHKIKWLNTTNFVSLAKFLKHSEHDFNVIRDDTQEGIILLKCNRQIQSGELLKINWNQSGVVKNFVDLTAKCFMNYLHNYFEYNSTINCSFMFSGI